MIGTSPKHILRQIENSIHVSDKKKKLWKFVFSGKVNPINTADKDDWYQIKFRIILNSPLKCETFYAEHPTQSAPDGFKDFEFETDCVEVVTNWNKHDGGFDSCWIKEVYNNSSEKLCEAKKLFRNLNFVVLEY